MDSVRPKLSEVADENDDTTQLKDDFRRIVQACLQSAEEEDDEIVTPGFRLHQTEEELVEFFLRRKAEKKPMNAELIKELDLYKYDPWDLSRSTIYSETRPVEQSQLKCPRCNSQNTKFCSYNNYSLSQPRHFCKTCWRYWTEGGTLRNIPSFSATSFASNRSSSAASTSKNERENSNNRGKIAETSPLKDPSTVGYDYKEWHFRNQTGRNLWGDGPNSVTGSGFWEPSGANNPTHYSNATPSGPNFASMDDQPQLSEPPSNQHPARPEVRIDISDGNTELSIHQSWKEYKDHLKNSQSDDDAMKIMSGTLMTVAGQFIGGMMVHKITSSAAASYEWPGSAVENATVLGLCVTLAGISLRGRSRAHSARMIRIGAVITASAIIFSMGLHLPPVVAWTVGPVMFLIMAVAAAFA